MTFNSQKRGFRRRTGLLAGLLTVDKGRGAAVKLMMLFCLCFSGAPAIAAEKAPLPRLPGPKTILAFGDSITAGYGLDREQSPPQQLEALLRALQLPVTVVNAGVSGDTTAGGVSRLEWTLKKQNPDYVILALGGNDMLRAIDPAVTEKNLRKMMDVLKRHEKPVLIAGMRAPANYGAAFAAAYDRMYAAVARDYGALFYPFLLDGVAMIPQYNQRDGVHPNAEGAAIIARKMLPYAVELLRRGNAAVPAAAPAP